MWSSDLLGVPLDGVWETNEYIPWEAKSDPRAVWRGSATGLFHNVDNAWRDSQRERLHWFAQNTSEGTQPILLDRGGKVEVAHFKVKDMNEKYFDVGLSGQPVQVCLGRTPGPVAESLVFTWGMRTNGPGDQFP